MIRNLFNDIALDRADIRDVIKMLTWFALWLILFYGFFFLFDITPLRILFINASSALIISAAICALSTLGVLAFLVKISISKKILLAIMLCCLLGNISINRLLATSGVFTPIEEASSKDPSGEDSGIESDQWVHHLALINLCLLGIALSGGLILGSIIKKPSYIIPLSLVAGMADIWSVFAGLTKEIAESRTALNYTLISYPVPGQGIIPIIGATDFLFAAMYFSISMRFNLSYKKTILLTITAFIVSLAAAALMKTGVPVLPVMAVLFIVGHYQDIRIVDPKEKKETLIGILLIAGILLLITLFRSL